MRECQLDNIHFSKNWLMWLQWLEQTYFMMCLLNCLRFAAIFYIVWSCFCLFMFQSLVVQNTKFHNSLKKKYIFICIPFCITYLQIALWFLWLCSSLTWLGQAFSYPHGACNGLFGILARELHARHFLMFWFHPKEVTIPECSPPLWVLEQFF